MKRDNKGSINVLYVEPGDEKQAVLNALSMPQEHKKGIVIVLPDKSSGAFQSPKDFHDIKLRKRQEDLPIVFVIANDSLTQWAKMNGFSVYPSLEAFTKSNNGKPSSPELGTDLSSSFSDSLAMPLHGHGNYPLSFIPPLGDSLNNIQEEIQPHMSDPITLLPLNADMLPAKDRPPAPPFLGNQFAPPTPMPPRPSPARILRLGRSKLFLVLTVIIIVTLLSATLLFTQKENIFHSATSHSTNAAASPTIVGRMFFTSSEQVDKMGSIGVNDIVKVSLTHIIPPAQGKKYYVWLRGDSNQSDAEAVLLGSLDVSSQGTTQLTYADPQHTDMLVNMSRFLITEEDAAVTPIVPSTDTATWRYEGGISQIPDPGDSNHFSLLDHLRHLLAAEPILEEQHLHGGLALWLYRNTAKLFEWSRSAPDDQNNGSVNILRNNIVRILDYLDGIKDVKIDTSAQTPVMVDPTLGSVGLLQIQAYQTPAAYIQQIGFHLTGLINSRGVSSDQRQLATQLHAALNQVQSWLQAARADAQHLVAMSNKQLQQPAAHALIDDMLLQVNNAYVGTVDPVTNSEQHGVNWIYTNMHSLATIDIHAYQK